MSAKSSAGVGAWRVTTACVYRNLARGFRFAISAGTASTTARIVAGSRFNLNADECLEFLLKLIETPETSKAIAIRSY